jgi:hypothetical protein
MHERSTVTLTGAPITITHFGASFLVSLDAASVGHHANIWSWAQMGRSANAPPNDVTFVSKEVPAPLKIISDGAVSVQCFYSTIIGRPESAPMARFPQSWVWRDSAAILKM